MGRPKGIPNRPKEIPGEPQITTRGPYEIQEEPVIPFRKLWELCHTHGATPVDRMDRDSVMNALGRVGYVQEEPKLEQVEDYWTFDSRFVGTGPVSAVDPNGNWSAVVNQDGSAVITEHIAPNLHNRQRNVQYQDQRIKIPNLEEFAVRLMLLVNETDAILDETVAERKRLEAEEVARIESQEGVSSPSCGGDDWKIAEMRIICPEFGFTGAHEPTVTELPFKLAQALGIETKGKDWQSLSSEVLEQAKG